MGTLTLTLLHHQYSIPDALYLDASFLVALRHKKEKHHAAALLLWPALLGEVAKSNAVVYCSALAVDECMWGLTRALYEDANGRDSWKRADRDRALRRYRPAQEALVKLLAHQKGLSFVDCGRRHIEPAFQEMRQKGLAPRDAFHVALARDCGAHCIVTNDKKLSHALTSDSDIDPFDYATIRV